MNGPTASGVDPKALTVAGIAMGITFVLWALKGALTGASDGAGWIIALLLLVGGGGYALYRRNSAAAYGGHGAWVQAPTDGVVGQAPAATAYQPVRQPIPFPGWITPTRPVATYPADGALISAVLVIPSLIAYAWRYESTGFTGPWQPWWILTGLHLYFVVCVAVRFRAGSSRLAAVLLGLIGTGLIGLADNPSGDVSLMTMFSTKRYSHGMTYYQPPSGDVALWISRAPLLATLIFVVAWGIARRRPSGWALGLIPAGLLVWWSIYGSEHGFAWQGGWFHYWLLSVGVFVGGCVCCWVAELLTSAGRMTTGAPAYSPPGWAGPVSPPAPRVNPPGAHADYRDQAAQHFHGPEQTYRPPGSQGGFR